jgi:hypothetical protein
MELRNIYRESQESNISCKGNYVNTTMASSTFNPLTEVIVQDVLRQVSIILAVYQIMTDL